MARNTDNRSTSRHAPSRVSVTRGIVLTGGAWLVTRFVVGASYTATRNPFAFGPRPWTQWDSLNYLDIAEHGIRFGRCDRAPFAAQPNPLHVKWCGNAGWLPGYPWITRIVHSSGLDFARAGLLLSWVAIATAMFLVWYGWCQDLGSRRSFLVLLLFGLFPGAVYNFAVFPTSSALALLVAALLALTKERYLFAALLTAGVGLCYPSAWFAAVGLVIGVVVMGHAFGSREMLRKVTFAVVSLSSLMVLILVDRPWNAFLLMDRQNGIQSSGLPGQDFLRLVFTQRTVEQQLLRNGFDAHVLAVQGLLAVLLAGIAAMSAYVAWRRKALQPSIFYPAVTGSAVVLGVLALGANGGAWNRSVVLAAPCVMCLRRLPFVVLVALVVAVGTTTALISHPFFTGRLV